MKCGAYAAPAPLQSISFIEKKLTKENDCPELRSLINCNCYAQTRKLASLKQRSSAVA